ncbi:MAG: hypothetical protein IKF71_03040 [Bacilli bacterium]|nr:hypothetical protein [Bacilli bacterium]
MKREKIIIIVCIVVLLIAILVLGIVESNSPKGNPNLPIGSGSSQSAYVSEWEDKLQEYFISAFREKYPDNSQFKLDKKKPFKMDLDELKEAGLDVSPFNTETIHCDTKKSYVYIEYDEQFQIYTRNFHLECKNDALTK